MGSNLLLKRSPFFRQHVCLLIAVDDKHWQSQSILCWTTDVLLFFYLFIFGALSADVCEGVTSLSLNHCICRKLLLSFPNQLAIRPLSTTVSIGMKREEPTYNKLCSMFVFVSMLLCPNLETRLKPVYLRCVRVEVSFICKCCLSVCMLSLQLYPTLQ